MGLRANQQNRGGVSICTVHVASIFICFVLCGIFICLGFLRTFAFFLCEVLISSCIYQINDRIRRTVFCDLATAVCSRIIDDLSIVRCCQLVSTSETSATEKKFVSHVRRECGQGRAC